MNVLALDPASTCGWAHSCGQSGTWDLSIRRDESDGMRLIRFCGKLTDILDGVGVDLVVYEAARHAGPGMQGALLRQAELQGVLKQWCIRNQVQYRGYSPGEIKKHATGKGNASKGLMVAAARRVLRRDVVDDNEADAVLLLRLALETLGR